MFNISRAKSGKLKCQKAPSLLGKQRKSGNIRFTVGQYWLIIKRTGTNYVNVVVNLVMCEKSVWCSEKIFMSGKIFEPLKWYTDRKEFVPKKFFWGLVGHNPKKSGTSLSAP
jgi:hypothetical protein